MKKALKLLVVLGVALTLCLSVLPFNTLAAGVIISFSSNSPTVGSTVTVTVKVTATEMYAVNIRGSYNEEVLTYQGGASQGGAGNFQITEALSGESSKSFSLTFKAAKAGSSNITVEGEVGDGIPSVDISVSASATMAVQDVSLSSNANLKALSLSAGSLSPRFSASKTEYTAEVKKSVTSCKIYATAAESGAKIAISGDEQLEIGANKRMITVTAPSGNKKTYTVTINRSNVDDEEETSSVAVPPSLEIVVLGQPHVVCQDISAVTLPTGFNVSKRIFGGEEVAVATDSKGEITLYYLKAQGSEEAFPFTYDELVNSFTRVRFIVQGEKHYMVRPLPEGFAASKDFYATTMEIDGGFVDCYASNDKLLKDFYFVYCYYNGEYGTYRYDVVGKVLQRSPEFKLIETLTDDAIANLEGKNLIERFKLLSSNGKTIAVGSAIVLLGIIALAVLFAVKFILRRKRGDFDLPETEDFDSLDISENFEIISGDDE